MSTYLYKVTESTLSAVQVGSMVVDNDERRINTRPLEP